jgi:hypothetical protein
MMNLRPSIVKTSSVTLEGYAPARCLAWKRLVSRLSICALLSFLIFRVEHAAERRWPRYKVDVPIQLATQGITNGIIVQGRGSELNCGGMAVSGSIELAIGEQVAVEFTPPHSGQPVSVRCFVRNRRRYAYGLEFIAENDFDYESVAQIEATLGHIAIAGSAEA